MDNGSGHFFNNYLQNITSYGNYSRGKWKVVVENSFFDKVNKPIQHDPEAELVSRGNILQECKNTEIESSKPKGEAFNPHDFYEYKLDEAKEVPELLKQHAAPQASIGTPEMVALMAKATQ